MKRYSGLVLGLLLSLILIAASKLYPSSIGKPGGGYSTIQDQGSPLAQRSIVNFTGGGITCTDNAPATDCDVPGTPASGGYDQIQDEGSNLTQRTTLNFTGAGITCTDASMKTNCNVPSSGAAPLVDSFANIAAASCTAGQLGISNDGFYLGACVSANTWNWLWRGRLVTPPPSSGWTFTNQGGSTATTAGGALALDFAGTPNQWRLYQRTAAATPYTVSASLFRLDLDTVATTAVVGTGLCFADGSGKLSAFYMLVEPAGGNRGFAVENWTNGTTFGGTVQSSLTTDPTSPYSRLALQTVSYLRLSDNGTNILYSYSGDDGATWIQYASQSRTAFFAAGPTTVGVCYRSVTAQGSFVTVANWTVQ